METKGKIISVLGDSITYGFTLENIDDRFTNLIAKKLDIQVNNYGIPGTSIAKSLVKSSNTDFDKDFISRVQDIDKRSDIVIVFGGSNDYGHSINPLGDCNSTDEYTFIGALRSLYSSLILSFPNSKIIVMTPLKRVDEKKIKPTPTRGEGSDRLKTFVDLILKISKEYKLEILDMYNVSGIDPSIECIKEMYMPDGMHPNKEGHQLIADIVIDFIKKL